MRLEFVYTLDDIREAAMPAIFAGNRRLYRYHWIAIIALSLLFTIFGMVVWVIQSKLGEPGPPQSLLLEILPSVAPFGGTGRDEYVKHLRSMPGSDAVEFCGRVEPQTFLRDLDVLVVPSIWDEPFGRVVVESYAQGVPVVGSAVGGIPEIIDIGRTGQTFPAGDCDELARVLKHLSECRGELSVMSDACIEKSREFDLARQTERYGELYRRVARMRKRCREGNAPSVAEQSSLLSAIL